MRKSDKYAQLQFFAFLFALPFAIFVLCFCFIKLFWLLVSMAGVPDIILLLDKSGSERQYIENTEKIHWTQASACWGLGVSSVQWATAPNRVATGLGSHQQGSHACAGNQVRQRRRRRKCQFLCKGVQTKTVHSEESSHGRFVEEGWSSKGL